MASTCIANQGGWSELANSYSTTSICMNLLDSGNQGYSIFQTHDDISATGMQTAYLSLSCILVRIKWMVHAHGVSATFEQGGAWIHSEHKGLQSGLANSADPDSVTLFHIRS